MFRYANNYIWKIEAILSYYSSYHGLRQKLQGFAVVVLFMLKDQSSFLKIILPEMLEFQPISNV